MNIKEELRLIKDKCPNMWLYLIEHKCPNLFIKDSFDIGFCKKDSLDECEECWIKALESLD